MLYFKTMGNHTQLKGSISNLFIKPKHGAPMEPRETLEAVADKGLIGDQAYGRNSRQILIVDQDMLNALDLEPGNLRENLTVEGMPIDSLATGTMLQSGDVVMKLVAICDPCKKLEGIRPGLMHSAAGMRGMLAVVVRGGQLHKGAPLRIAKEA
ncbi:MAG: hypothetical protein PVH60_03445 [Anaerolineales bacterium]|jgi:MOSC domain-containing protein YiiM